MSWRYNYPAHYLTPSSILVLHLGHRSSAAADFSLLILTAAALSHCTYKSTCQHWVCVLAGGGGPPTPALLLLQLDSLVEVELDRCPVAVITHWQGAKFQTVLAMPCWRFAGWLLRNTAALRCTWCGWADRQSGRRVMVVLARDRIHNLIVLSHSWEPSFYLFTVHSLWQQGQAGVAFEVEGQAGSWGEQRDMRGNWRAEAGIIERHQTVVGIHRAWRKAFSQGVH